MLNDIIKYSLRYELWSYDIVSFYKEYEYEKFIRFADLNGNTIDITPDLLAIANLIDDTIDLVPEWLKKI
jgi:hypothetical protein